MIYVNFDVRPPAPFADPLLADLHTLARRFPNRDPNKIFAYLEAYRGNPDRVAKGTDELLNTQPAADVSTVDQEPPNALQFLSQAGISDGWDAGMWAEGRGRVELEALFRMFPDCDPDHIVARLNAWVDQPDRFEKLATELAD